MKRWNNAMQGVWRIAAACAAAATVQAAQAAAVTVSTLHSFTGVAGSASVNGTGAQPATPPVHHDGRLYGTTLAAGQRATSSGVLYALQAPDGGGYSATNLNDLPSYTGTLSAGNGRFYLAPGWKTDVFSFTAAATLPAATGIAATVPLTDPSNRGLWHFDAVSIGAYANSLYFYKISSDNVYLYRHAPSSNTTVLLRQWSPVDDLAAPFHAVPSSVTVGRDGAVYGVMDTYYRNAFQIEPELEGKPFIYRVQPDGSGYEKLAEFTDALGAGYPISYVLSSASYFSALVDGGDGWLYGATYSQETRGTLQVPATSRGTVFRVSQTERDTVTGLNKVEVLHTFEGGTADGEGASGPIVFAADGNIYGTTRGGGANGAGTLWGLVLGAGVAPAYEVLHSFTESVDGKTPVGLSLGTDGWTLYGAAQSGGTHNQAASTSGTVFKVAIARAARILSFSASTATVQQNNPIQLSWSTEEAVSCTAGGDNGGAWSGAQQLQTSGVPTGNLTRAGQNTFTLSCTGADGVAVEATPLTVEVTAAPTTPTTPTTPESGGGGGGPLSAWLLVPLALLGLLRRRPSARA